LILPADVLNSLYKDEPANEKLCQTLWQCYYNAGNIAQRSNPKLHLG
jgi:hypothetical protein